MMGGHKQKQTYEVVVAADAAEEAVAVAAEALPADAVVVKSSAVPVGDAGNPEDPRGESWRVVLTYTGGARRAKKPAA